MVGWWVASKGLRPLPRTRGSALAHGCGRGGRAVLPLPRAAAVSAGLRVRDDAAHALLLLGVVVDVDRDGQVVGRQGERGVVPHVLEEHLRAHSKHSSE